jgi:flagellar protein FliO/FliZ
MPQSIALAQALPLLGAIIAFLFAALLVLYIFRLLFGQRVRAPAGTRNRPRRLDVVDTFELGRDRQLVVIRRDNVEHLLLIGGPNDLLVEGSISRMEARDQRPAPPPPREKEAAAAAEWPAAPPAARPAPPPGPAPGRAGPPPAEPPRRRPLEPAAAQTPSLGQQPSGRVPGSSLPPLPADMFAAGAPEKHAAAPTEAPPPRPTPSAQPPRPPAPPPPRASSPPFLARAQRPAGAPPKRDAPPPGPPPAREPQPAKAAPPTPAPAAREQRPAQTPAPPPPEPSSDPLESLEAEMARLLGRPDSK